MPIVKWQKVVANRYNHLLLAEMAVLIGHPVLRPIETRFPITVTLYLAAVIPALHVVLRARAFYCLVSVGLLGFAIHLLGQYGIVPYRDRIYTGVLLLYTPFFLITIVVLVRRIASRSTVTAETVKGGIGVYFLIGLLFTLVYLVLYQFDPEAYANVAEPGADLFYYSFVTLTTLGYGDVTPVSAYAKNLAILEALVGQIYLAVFIAQLVGLRLAERLSGKDAQ